MLDEKQFEKCNKDTGGKELWKIRNNDGSFDMNNNLIFDTENQAPNTESKSKKRKILARDEHEQKRASIGQPLRKKIAY